MAKQAGKGVKQAGEYVGDLAQSANLKPLIIPFFIIQFSHCVVFTR